MINEEKRKQFMQLPTAEVLRVFEEIRNRKLIMISSIQTCLTIALERIVKMEEEIEQMKQAISKTKE